MISGGGVEEERNYEMAMDGTILLRRFVGSGWVTRFDFYLRRGWRRSRSLLEEEERKNEMAELLSRWLGISILSEC